MSQDTVEANLFELSCSGTEITYSTSSFAGPPQFSYSGLKGNHQFSGDEIDVQRTKLGTEVTVTLETSPDRLLLTLTVVLPHVTATQGEEHSITSVGIFTSNHTTIAGPPPVEQSYETIELHGVAKSVLF
jgi:hypothetical protein